MKNIYVLGSGFMGRGIAQVMAAAGYDVKLWDLKVEDVESSIDKMKESLQRRVSSGKMLQEDMDLLLTRVVPSADKAEMQDADLVIEAIIENFEIKKNLFLECEDYVSDTCILATNTSSLSISSLASVLAHPERFIGLHFFSPVPANKLVEIVRGLKTSDETLETSREVIRSIGKEGVLVKDSPGFLVNRVMHAFRNECMRCLEEGIASMEDIDTAVRLGLAHPMGPFELNDFAGLDIGYATAETLYEGFKDPKWKPNLMVKKLVESGDLGRKTGKGWYDYTSGEKKVRDDIHL